MKGWKNLGAVQTIYEEEYEFSSSSSSLSLSPSPPTPFHSRVQKWSVAAGRNTEVVIRVRGKCFHLHKDPLTSRSTYFKRQLTASVSEFTLSPPLNISAETFTLVADFCYGSRLVVTPFNLAALRTAAELLEMTEANGDDDDSLVHVTETYFRWVVAVNAEYASIVFRSSLTLLPEAETAASLVSRCVEALNQTDDGGGNGNGNGGVDWIEDVILTVRPKDFHIVAEAMQRRFNSHDVVYKIVDLYIRGHSGKITEDQKAQISSCIDCNKLTPKLLLEAVQNPIMPLRFVVRAMLVEQLNTRRCIISTAATSHHRRHHSDTPPATTLGALLQRDAAIRQASQLKASLHATRRRIQSLEEELSGMKKLLHHDHNHDHVHVSEHHHRHKPKSIMDQQSASARSASFHFGAETNRVAKADRLSASSASFRSGGGRAVERARRTGGSSSGGGLMSLSGSCKGSDNDSNTTKTPRMLTKRISQRLMNGLKKAFGVRPINSNSNNINKESKFKSNNNNNINKLDIGEHDYDLDLDHGGLWEYGNGDVIVIKEQLS